TELGKALASKGHEILFISYSKPVRLDSGLKNIFFHEVSVIDYPLFDYSPYEILLSSKLTDVARQYKLDLFHAHYAIPHASAAYMAKQVLASHGVRIAVVTTLHGTDITLLGKDPAFEPVITFSINQSDAVTAVSQSLKEDTFKYFPVKKDIRVIPNFVCLEEYKIENREEKRKEYASYGEKILLHVSNFRKVKRVEDVLRVFAQVRKQIPAKLVLVGDGPEKENIEKLCKELDTCGDIHSLGKVKDVEKIIGLADLFILASETESFGLAALEAMAARVPVISTNMGGIPEVNVHGFSGMVSNVGDIDDMAKNALAILKDEKIIQQFRTNAYEQSKNFSIEKILPMYEKVYSDVISTTDM
ncbi:MAG: N-acetyl-alpha-D-glucosaminyl L-malate synthase BshA, partial [Bacteroidota bacterium]